MSAECCAPRFHPGEEIANTVIHGAGALLAIGGLVVLTVLASRFGNAWHIVGCSVFGGSLVLLCLASAVYHATPHVGARAFLRRLDHAAIFILIAGTYTPFTLVNLRGPWGWSLLGTIWGIALLGILFQAALQRRSRLASLLLYLGMGWVVVAAIKPLLSSLAPAGMVLLAAGGAAYTLGTVFYAWQRLPYGHAIWHVFVLAGSVLHFFAVLFYVIPLANLPGG